MAKIEQKFRLDVIDSSPSGFYKGPDSEEKPNGQFVSWQNIKLPLTIKDGIAFYWADGWDTIRGTRLSNVKSITRLTYCDNVLIVEEIIWENTGNE